MPIPSASGSSQNGRRHLFPNSPPRSYSYVFKTVSHLHDVPEARKLPPGDEPEAPLGVDRTRSHLENVSAREAHMLLFLARCRLRSRPAGPLTWNTHCAESAQSLTATQG